MRPTPVDREYKSTAVERDGDSVIGVLRSRGRGRQPSTWRLRWRCSTTVAAEASTSCVGFAAHVFPRCFVCGPERAAGRRPAHLPRPALHGSDVVAAPWAPHPSLAEKDRNGIPPAFVWAALDCPGAFALIKGDASKPMLLGRLTARIEGIVRPGEECVVIAWRIGAEGRKRIAGSAVYGEDGRARGIGRAIWFFA